MKKNRLLALLVAATAIPLVGCGEKDNRTDIVI